MTSKKEDAKRAGELAQAYRQDAQFISGIIIGVMFSVVVNLLTTVADRLWIANLDRPWQIGVVVVLIISTLGCGYLLWRTRRDIQFLHKALEALQNHLEKR